MHTCGWAVDIPRSLVIHGWLWNVDDNTGPPSPKTLHVLPDHLLSSWPAPFLLHCTFNLNSKAEGVGGGGGGEGGNIFHQVVLSYNSILLSLFHPTTPPSSLSFTLQLHPLLSLPPYNSTLLYLSLLLSSVLTQNCFFK